MFHLFLLLLCAILTIILFSLTYISADDIVRVNGRSRPNVMAAPLTPSLQCSACEVTVREVQNTYAKKSKLVKFYGTDVELADLLDAACEKIPSRYKLAQENFGARLKVFADPENHFDRQTTERVQFYHELDEQRYFNVINRLKRFCETFVDKFYESHFRHHVFGRTDEQTMKYDMCLNNATQLCHADSLAPYTQIETRKRRRWKRKTDQRKRMEDKLKVDVDSHSTTIGDDDQIDFASTEEL